VTLCYKMLETPAVGPVLSQCFYDSSRNVLAHGDEPEGKWRGNWRMEWVASTLHTTSEHGVSSITTVDAHTSAASSRLNWRPPANLNGLVCFAERLYLVPACLPSHFKRSLSRITVRRGRGQEWVLYRHVTGMGKGKNTESLKVKFIDGWQVKIRNKPLLIY